MDVIKLLHQCITLPKASDRARLRIKDVYSTKQLFLQCRREHSTRLCFIKILNSNSIYIHIKYGCIRRLLSSQCGLGDLGEYREKEKRGNLQLCITKRHLATTIKRESWNDFQYNMSDSNFVLSYYTLLKLPANLKCALA